MPPVFIDPVQDQRKASDVDSDEYKLEFGSCWGYEILLLALGTECKIRTPVKQKSCEYSLSLFLLDLLNAFLKDCRDLSFRTLKYISAKYVEGG